MENKTCIARRYYKFMACFTALFMIAGIVLYIFLMVRTFGNGTDWLTGTWLVLGLVAMVTFLPTLANFFMGRACGDKYHLNDHIE